MLGLSFGKLLIILLAVAAAAAIVAIAWSLITGRSKEAERAMSDATKNIGRDITNMQNGINNSVNSIQTTSNNLPRYARGTSNHPGGRAIVGEEGPEIVDLPPGSRVYTARQTQRMLSPDNGAGTGRGVVQHISLNVHMDEIDQVYKLTQLFESFGHKSIVYEGV
jgi:HAMP domain-containing protein